MRAFTSSVIIAHLFNLSTIVHGSALRPRQASCSDISTYFKQITTALFSVNYLQQFVHPCDLNDFPAFEAQGLDGSYALDLICLYDEGTQLFNETLDVVNENLVVAWIGLFAATINASTPARNLSCEYLDINLLNELKLDASTIQSIICDFSPCGVTTSTSSTVSASSTAFTSSSSTFSTLVSSSALSSTASSSSGFFSPISEPSSLYSVSTSRTTASSNYSSRFISPITEPSSTGRPTSSRSSSSMRNSSSTVSSSGTGSSSSPTIPFSSVSSSSSPTIPFSSISSTLACPGVSSSSALPPPPPTITLTLAI